MNRISMTFRTTALAGYLLTMMIVGSGCETRVVSERRAPWSWAEEHIAEQERRSSGGGQRTSATNPDDPYLTAEGPREEVWAIAVDAYDGPDQQQKAAAAMERFSDQTMIRDFWIDQSAGQTVIYLGRYRSPRSERAQEDMALLKGLVDTGRLIPSRKLMILTPLEGSAVASDRLDLRSVAGMGSYTLQIGFYEGEGRHDAAEKAVRTLRDENFDAFYYHGPNYSLITVGIFAETEVALMPVDPGNQDNTKLEMYYSPRIEQLKERFPHNLANGRQLMETHAGRTRVQPSFVVKIPGS